MLFYSFLLASSSSLLLFFFFSDLFFTWLNHADDNTRQAYIFKYSFMETNTNRSNDDYSYVYNIICSAAKNRPHLSAFVVVLLSHVWKITNKQKNGRICTYINTHKHHVYIHLAYNNIFNFF